MGTGGESLALAISKLDTCETLSHVKYSNGRTSTIDIFGSLFRGPGSKTGKYKFTKQIHKYIIIQLTTIRPILFKKNI